MFMQTVDDNLWIFHMTIKKQIIIIWNNEQTQLFIDISSLTGLKWIGMFCFYKHFVPDGTVP